MKPTFANALKVSSRTNKKSEDSMNKILVGRCKTVPTRKVLFVPYSLTVVFNIVRDRYNDACIRSY